LPNSFEAVGNPSQADLLPAGAQDVPAPLAFTDSRHRGSDRSLDARRTPADTLRVSLMILDLYRLRCDHSCIAG
jgi:hypothetical protein